MSKEPVINRLDRVVVTENRAQKTLKLSKKGRFELKNLGRFSAKKKRWGQKMAFQPSEKAKPFDLTSVVTRINLR